MCECSRVRDVSLRVLVCCALRWLVLCWSMLRYVVWLCCFANALDDLFACLFGLFKLLFCLCCFVACLGWLLVLRCGV